MKIIKYALHPLRDNEQKYSIVDIWVDGAVHSTQSINTATDTIHAIRAFATKWEYKRYKIQDCTMPLFT